MSNYVHLMLADVVMLCAMCFCLGALITVALVPVLGKHNNWYVSSTLEVIEKGHEGVLAGRYGNGKTPKEAVENHWEKIVVSPKVKCIVVDAMGTRRGRREVRWNGFMWQDYVE